MKQYPPFIAPMRLARVPEPFDHPDWIYEIKYDGWRGIACCDGSATRLVSRHGNTFAYFRALAADICAALGGRCAVLDGEIVCLGPDGKPQFHELRRRGAQPYYMAFDVLWLDGLDLRALPLIRRKEILAGIITGDGRVRYAGHVERRGVDLFRAACEQDLEGIVAKHRDGIYDADARRPAWLKIKSPAYSQAVDRGELFGGRRGQQGESIDFLPRVWNPR